MEKSYETVNENGYVGSKNINGHLNPRQKHSPRLSWLDLRVFYVRFSRCDIGDDDDDHDSTPDHLTLHHIPLDPNTLLEVNGVRASIYSDGVSTLLRRDRLDKKSEEATFVSTDSIRLSGSVKFEVFDKDVLVISGSLEKCENNGYIDGDEFDHATKLWSIHCESDVNSRSGFLRGKKMKGCELGSPTIEVYVAGCFLGTPIMLTKTLNVNLKRKQSRLRMLTSIPEYDAMESEKESTTELALQVPYSPYYKPGSEGYNDLYRGTEYLDGEDGELLWFNAGVRVGVGIGLSVCLGVGIGVGLLVKTYQGTTRTLRRRFF